MQSFDQATPHESQCAAYAVPTSSLEPHKIKFLSIAFLRPRAIRMGLILVVGSGYLASTVQASAQASFVFPSPVNVGDTVSAQAVSVPITIKTAGTVGSVRVLTQGSTGLDFTKSSDTCVSGFSSNVGDPCTVFVNFAPRYPGLRVGAILLISNDGHTVLASRGLSAIGKGSLAVFSPGEITTVAGDGCESDGACPDPTSPGLSLPMGQATDAAGNLYFSDTGNHRIRRIDAITGVISTIAGFYGVPGSSVIGGLAKNAQVNAPSAIVVDGAGNIIFADTGNNSIRRITVVDGDFDNATISTIAGTLGVSGDNADSGAATAATLARPQGFAFDADGNLYIADTFNHRIRKVDAGGNISTFSGSVTAGFNGDGSVASSGRFNSPKGINVASDGSLYIADFGNNRIRKIDLRSPTALSTVVGGFNAGYADGDLANATLNSPTSVVVDPAGNLYIADSENNAIRKVNSADHTISTFAGNGSSQFSGDGLNANLAGLYKPYSVYLDGAGNLLLADRLDLRIRKVSATLAGIQYPRMKEGKISAPVPQTVQNDGNDTLTLTDLMAQPTNNAKLDTNQNDSITPLCSTAQTLATGLTCTLLVEFAPVVVDPSQTPPQSGLLSITSQSVNSPLIINLFGEVLTVDPSSTTVTSDLPTAGVGMGVDFVAHIRSPNQVTGTVQFYDGAALIGVPQPVDPSTNTATITTSFTVLQSHSITAVYTGDNLNAASSPNTPFIETIEQSTALNVIPSADPAVQFAPITFTATVGGWTTPPTGSITFTDNSVPLGAAILNGSGVATFAVPPMAVGSHTITATFPGDANDFTSQYTFVQTIDLAPSSTTLSTSGVAAQYATPIIFTVTVTGVNTSTPTGFVDFKDGTTVIASEPVNTLGVATYTNSTLTAGTHTITAVYRGDANYAGSTSSQIVTETIGLSSTSTTLSSSTTNTISGRPVTFAANVAATGTVPTGTVDFMNGNILLGTQPLNRGIATFTTTDLGIGTNNVIAIYSGDSNNSISRSLAIGVTVVQSPTTTIVSSSQSPLLTLTPVVISATVTNGGAKIPTGLVTFLQDSVSIGVATLDASGVATISLPKMAAGSHSFTANYAGDALDTASVSNPFTEVVQLRSTTDILTASATSLTGGQQLTLIAVIRTTGSSASSAPTGNVTFMSGKLTLATTAIDSTGVATVTVLLPGTSATISSNYNGDANYGASSSTPTQITIGPAPDFSLQATPTTWEMQSKQHIDVDLTLTSVKNFTGSFSLGCLGLPQYATCTFSHDKTDLPAGGSQTVKVTVDTGNPLMGGTQASNESNATSKVIVACLFPGCLLFGCLTFRIRRIRLLSGLLLFVGLFGVSSGLSGCGSIENSGTAPGTYNFMITATGQTGVSQYINMTMTITQ